VEGRAGLLALNHQVPNQELFFCVSELGFAAPAKTIDTVAGRFDIRASSITVVGPTSPDGAGRDRLSVLEPWGTHSGSSAMFPQTSSCAPNRQESATAQMLNS